MQVGESFVHLCFKCTVSVLLMYAGCFLMHIFIRQNRQVSTNAIIVNFTRR